MPAKTIRFGSSAQNQILQGATLLAKTVATTYGPHGRTCILDRLPGMLATKDGVTVAREVTLPNRVQNLGAETLKSACIRVNEEVGDGTTTVAVLAGALMEHGRKVIAAGLDPLQVAAGIQAAGELATEVIQTCSQAVVDQKGLERVAFIASNGDQEISQHLAEACMAVGKDGAILIEDGKGIESTLSFKEGMEVNQGMISPAFVSHSSVTSKLKSETESVTERIIEGPLVAVIPQILSKLDDVRELMEVASQWPQNELLVFALDVVGEALATMLTNNSMGVVKCIAVRAPGGGQRESFLKDIAALAGADYVDPVAGYDIQAWDATWFGSLRQASIGVKSSVLIAYEESSAAIDKRLAEIRGEENHCKSDYDRDRLRERKAKLTGGLAVLAVGGITEAAMKERRARVEDALSAVQAALKSGIVPGGGAVYLTASLVVSGTLNVDQSEDFRAGWKACGKALRRPVEMLARNAGTEPSILIERILGARKSSENTRISWDAVRDEVRDLTVDPPVIDPTSVAVSVVEAACSVVSTLLTSGVAITAVGFA